MKLTEIRELSVQEINTKITDTELELANIKFQHSLHQLDNVIKIRLVRRELARLKCVLREHQLGKRLLSSSSATSER